MKNNKFFPEHQKKLKTEAVIRSVLCGLTIGFGVNFLAALAIWFMPVNDFLALILSMPILLVVTAVVAWIFYVKRFRPNDTMNARRIDRLGLDERAITMVELENDDSYMAKAQRADAQAALANVDKKQLKMRISGAVIALVVICAVLSGGMNTVNALGGLGVIPSGDELLNSVVDEVQTVYVKVDYVAGTGGMIEGDESQIIVQGTDTEFVTAVAEDGYMFKRWSDGVTDPTRNDLAVMEDITITAVFMELDDDGSDDDGEGDKPTDAVGNSNLSNGDENDEGDDDNDSDNESSGGGAWEPNNQIIDGKTYYRDILEEYQEAAEELLKDPDNGLTEAEIELIKKYLGVV